jgi:indolepyruvate ferredoxin oxidoreductase alpha subunit
MSQHPLLSSPAGSTELLLGNEAIVRGALEAGVQFVTCYPGTPSSEVPDTFFRLAHQAGVHFEYSTNEKVAVEVGGGAALAGTLTLATMKHVGLNVAADPLMTLCYTGTPGGFLLLSADDPGCHSSQNEQDNRYYARLAGLPCLEPASAQEAKDMTREGLLLSRRLGAPFLLRTTTRVNHLRGPVVFGPLSERAAPSGFKKKPRQFVPIPAFARPMHVELLKRMQAFRAEAEASRFNRRWGKGRLGVIASGVSRAYLADALALSGLAGTVRVLELGFTHPLPERLVTQFVRGLDKVLIVEELDPILEQDVRALVQRRGLAVAVLGKEEAGLPRNGEFSTGLVEDALRRLCGKRKPRRPLCPSMDGLPQRPPNLCAGCPHRATFFAVRKTFGDAAVYSTDIGCYTLGILPPLSAADFLLCMGSSISAGCGAAKAAGQLVVAFIGDSTFFHSGITGLINAVHNGHTLIVVVMDNHTTAMTGHQPHPGVRKTVFGENVRRVDIEAVVKGCGVEHVRTVNPLNHKAALKALDELKGLPGVRVLIADHPCPLHSRRVDGPQTAQVAYVTESCEGKGECLASLACPAFFKDGAKAAINPHLCSGCMLCLQVCRHIKARKGDRP